MISVGILLFVIIMAAMLLFAVLSNGLVIYCVIKIKKLRTITNAFICNLSISDILLAGFIMPQRLHDISHRYNFFEGEMLCKLVNFFPLFVISSSVYTLVCISFERHRVIIDSQASQMSTRRLAILIGFTWAFALLVSLPTLLEYTVTMVHDHDKNTTTFLSCGSWVSHRLSLANAIFVFIISYVIPVILMMKNYLQVALFVWRKGRRIKDNTDSSGPNLANFHLLTHRMKLVKLLVLVAVIFAVSWLPFYVTLLYAKTTGNDTSENAAGFVNLLLIALATFSTAYNVVLYHIFNPSFKRAIRDTLRCRCTCTKTTTVHAFQELQDKSENSKKINNLPQNGRRILKTSDDNGRVFVVRPSLS